MATERVPMAFHVMTKPIGPICNLDCRYCFYLEKSDLYPNNRRWAMPDDILERYIREYIAAHEVPEVNFAWQGGEPTLLGVRYFQRIVELQQRYAGGKRITNAFQTNGTLIDDEWGGFLHDNQFLVGLSIDGPRDLHDAYRVDKRGRPTFDRVMQGLEVLKRHRVEFNTLTVVNRRNAQYPIEVYRFLKAIGSQFIQFIPLVERLPEVVAGSDHHLAGPPDREAPQAAARVTPWSVEPRQYGQFLVRIFDEWVRRDVGAVFVQVFDAALAAWAGAGPSLCVFAETCGLGLAMEHNGDLYACDHYVYDEYRRGNIRTSSLLGMVTSDAQVRFGRSKGETLPSACRECAFLFACWGECPKHRFCLTPDGEDGLNYLCPAYKAFYRHIDRPMRTMTDLLAQQRAPAEIMAMLAESERGVNWDKVGRNDACPCGSGRKFKQCCMASRSAQLGPP